MNDKRKFKRVLVANRRGDRDPYIQCLQGTGNQKRCYLLRRR